jgi:hypothetical protein
MDGRALDDDERYGGQRFDAIGKDLKDSGYVR